MENEIAAVYRVVRDRLTENIEVWGDRAYAEIAPAKTGRPFITWSVIESRDIEWRPQAASEVVLSVQVTADDLAGALAGAARVAELLDDADRGAANQLDGGDDWTILNVSRVGAIQRAELVDGVIGYRAGGRYRVLLEANSA